MLTIAKVESSRAAYYLSTTASGSDHEGGLVEPDGVWLGRLSASLGLAGVAAPAAVRALLGARSPLDGSRLFPREDRRRLSAYDCTFSTPKSVSVLFALGRPEVTDQVRLAHEDAVVASLDYLERHGVCVREGRVDGRTRLSKGEDGLAAVGWLHRSSRAADPHLHTHVLVANLARRASGEWAPLDARDLYAELRTAGALFETHLRGELTARLGLRWLELSGAWADIEGSDRRILRSFSQRSTQIERELAASGLKGRAAARLVAELTRPPKDVATPYPQLVEGWRRRAHEEGLAPAHLENMLGRGPGRLAGSSVWEPATIAAAHSRSLDGTFGRRELIEARCATAPAGLSAGTVESDVDQLLASPRLLACGLAGPGAPGLKRGGAPPSRPEARYTTAEVAAGEDRIVAGFAERPFEMTVIAYQRGGRAGALDELSKAASTWSAEGRQVAAAAPGWRAAASFEAATGIESVSIRAVVPPGPGSAAAGGRHGATAWMPDVAPRGVVVMADAHCLSSGVLEQVLRYSRTISAELVLFGPAREIEGRRLLSGVARAAKGRLPEPPEASRESGMPPQVLLRRRFGEAGAVVTTSLRGAMSEAGRQLQEATPASVLVVAPDHGIVQRLREEVGAGRAAFVVHANDLRQTIDSGAVASPAGDDRPPRLVVIGGSSALQMGATRPRSFDRCHLIVMPAPGGPSKDVEGRRRQLGIDAVVGLAAEACRPRYLTAELGQPGRDRAERAEWRSAAAAIEDFRERWGVTDDRRAFGPCKEAGLSHEAFELERQAVKGSLAEQRFQRRLGNSPSDGLGLGR